MSIFQIKIQLVIFKIILLFRVYKYIGNFINWCFPMKIRFSLISNIFQCRSDIIFYTKVFLDERFVHTFVTLIFK